MIEKQPDFARCYRCGGQIVVRIWGEGIDSEVFCNDCDEEEIYR